MIIMGVVQDGKFHQVRTLEELLSQIKADNVDTLVFGELSKGNVLWEHHYAETSVMPSDFDNTERFK